MAFVMKGAEPRAGVGPLPPTTYVLLATSHVFLLRINGDVKTKV